MVLKPPTYHSYKGLEYVRNGGMLFWGALGAREVVSVDGKRFESFALVNDSQIAAEGQAAQHVLAALKGGTQLRLEKHYWDSRNRKAYPTFELRSVKGVLNKLGAASSSGFTVSEEETKCRSDGARKVVWLENAHGSFALNGQAVQVVESSQAAGTPWLDSQGRRVQLGRDSLGLEVTTALLEAGLRKCD